MRSLVEKGDRVEAKQTLGELEHGGRPVPIRAPRAGIVVHVGALAGTFLRSEDAPYAIADERRRAISFDDPHTRHVLGAELEVEGDPSFRTTLFSRAGARVLGTLPIDLPLGTALRAIVPSACKQP